MQVIHLLLAQLVLLVCMGCSRKLRNPAFQENLLYLKQLHIKYGSGCQMFHYWGENNFLIFAECFSFLNKVFIRIYSLYWAGRFVVTTSIRLILHISY
jgi:hypothetical protein